MIDIEKLTALAIAYDAGDAKRIQHFISASTKPNGSTARAAGTGRR